MTGGDHIASMKRSLGQRAAWLDSAVYWLLLVGGCAVFLLMNFAVDPLKIEIAGNEKAIAGVDTLMTEKISLAGVTGNTDRTVKLVLPEGIAVTNQEVGVHLLVKEKKKE